MSASVKDALRDYGEWRTLIHRNPDFYARFVFDVLFRSPNEYVVVHLTNGSDLILNTNRCEDRAAIMNFIAGNPLFAYRGQTYIPELLAGFDHYTAHQLRQHIRRQRFSRGHSTDLPAPRCNRPYNVVRRFPPPDPLISPLPVSPLISPLPSTPTTEFETAPEYTDGFTTVPEPGTADKFVTASKDDDFHTPPHPPPLDLIPPRGIGRPRGRFFPEDMMEGLSRPRGTFYDPLWRPPHRHHHRRRGPAVLPTDDKRDSSPFISLEEGSDTTVPSTETDNERWERLVTIDDIY